MKRYPLLIQLVLYVFIFILLMLCLVGSIYYRTSSTAIEQTTEQNTRNSIQQGGQFINAYLQKLKQTTNSLVENDLVKNYAQEANADKETALRQLLATVLKTDKDMVSAVLVTKNGQLISTDPSLTMETSTDMMKEKWYQAAIDQGAMPVLTPARLKDKEKWVVSITQEVVDKDGNNLGVLRLDIAYNTLESYLDQLHLGKKGFAFIVNSEHEFVYHPKKSVYSSSQEMKAMQPYIAVKDGYIKDKSAYVSQYQVPHSGWTLIGVSSMEQLHAVQSQILWSFIGTGLLALGVSLLGIWLVLRLWIKPLQDLQATILAIGDGQADLRADQQGSPELVDLAQQFNRMLDQIEDLMRAVKEEEQNVRKYELQALSSQINPHFLYNTLDTIVWMAEFNDSKRVVEVTKSLAKYFRLALNQGHEQIALKDEIDHVRQYLFIQKQRYGHKLNYDIKEIANYDNYMLPKLVLQPLVENAIYHGIKEKAGQGKIEVLVEEDKDVLMISVYDDGQGFALQESTDKTLLRLGGVGLKNVDQRLRLQFGQAYHMDIQSQKGQFSKVTLYLPKNCPSNQV